MKFTESSGTMGGTAARASTRCIAARSCEQVDGVHEVRLDARTAADGRAGDDQRHAHAALVDRALAARRIEWRLDDAVGRAVVADEHDVGDGDRRSAMAPAPESPGVANRSAGIIGFLPQLETGNRGARPARR
jgi:hypothetical protein